MASPSAKSSPFPKLPENSDVCGDQLPSYLARIGVTRHLNAATAANPVVSMGTRNYSRRSQLLGRSNAALESSTKRLHVTAIVRIEKDTAGARGGVIRC